MLKLENHLPGNNTREEYYMPIWIKALLGFALVILGIFFTFLTFRFVPVPKEAGFDGWSGLLYVFIALGVVLLVFIIGLMMDKKHPYTLFGLCLGGSL